jgi:Tfp pilus assembly protein PilE
MKHLIKAAVGVTLLEIMLVLAVAAMIVVMSIRYYQAAQTSQKANLALSEAQAIMAAMDNLGVSAGYGGVTQTNLSAVAGSLNMKTPNGGSVVLGTVTATTYTITMPLTAATCPSVSAKLQGNSKITATCSGNNLAFTYNNTQ